MEIYIKNNEKSKENKIENIEKNYEEIKTRILNEYNNKEENVSFLYKIKERIKNSFENYKFNYFYCNNFSNIVKNTKDNISQKLINYSNKELIKENTELKSQNEKLIKELNEKEIKINLFQKVVENHTKGKLEQGIKNIIGLSIGAHIPTEVTAPIIISNAFKNICALSLGMNIPTDLRRKLKTKKKKGKK